MPTRRTLLAWPLLVTACAHVPPAAPLTRSIELPLPGAGAPMRAWLTLPRGYDERARRAWPLLVFLHGTGECGVDLEKVRTHGPPKHAAAGREYPFVLCSPQLEVPSGWPPARLHALRKALQARWHIDPARVLATGLSLGGHGVWNWATAYPGDLAAIAPICGAGDATQVCRASQVPVRAYHGADDPVVPLARQQACIDALRACGGEAEFIVYPGVGHGAWEPAYDDPALVPWLMRQTRQMRQTQGRAART
jgi:predicted peptidase